MRRTVLNTLKALMLAHLMALSSLTHAQQGDDPNVTAVRTEDPEMNAAIAMAQRTLPSFLDLLDKPRKGTSQLSFKFPLGGQEHIWMGNVRREADHLVGQLSNVPQQTDWAYGDTVRVPLYAVSDWAWRDAKGVMQGHYITRVILRRIDPERAALIRKNFGWDD
jgi:uncharacterized protein YegJ (DUF2314 family)